MIDESRVLDALSTVCDPELDEPITALGFVKEVRIDGDAVTVTLWLPTYFCAPNFAYIMAADAKAAVGAVEGVTDIAIRLVDHHAADEINDGLAAGRDFDETFPGETAGSGLAEVRLRFDRKAFVARQQQLYRSLAEGGLTPAEILRLTIADLPPAGTSTGGPGRGSTPPGAPLSSLISTATPSRRTLSSGTCSSPAP